MVRSVSFSYHEIRNLCLTQALSSFILLPASPNRASLGATNGLCQMAVSICRAIGPAGANSLFSLSLKQSFLGGYMVYYVLLATVCASLVVASFLPSPVVVVGK